MRVSIVVTNYSWPGGPGRLDPELAWLAGATDQAGMDTMWVVDHLLQADPTAPPDDTEMLEAYTTPPIPRCRYPDKEQLCLSPRPRRPIAGP
jgi:hypothetical protein